MSLCKRYSWKDESIHLFPHFPEAYWFMYVRSGLCGFFLAWHPQKTNRSIPLYQFMSLGLQISLIFNELQRVSWFHYKILNMSVIIIEMTKDSPIFFVVRFCYSISGYHQTAFDFRGYKEHKGKSRTDKSSNFGILSDNLSCSLNFLAMHHSLEISS